MAGVEDLGRASGQLSQQTHLELMHIPGNKHQAEDTMCWPQGGSLLACSGDGGDGGGRAGSESCGNGNLSELLAPYGVALQADAVISLVQQVGPLPTTASGPPHRPGPWILQRRRLLAALG